MLKLPRYDFRKHGKIATSNFADRCLFKSHVCCGWMDLHTDSVAGINSKPPWTIFVHGHHLNAVFVYRENKVYKQIEIVDGQTITFDPRHRHGVLPRKLAAQIVAKNTCKFKEYLRWRSRIDGCAMKPKLIFNFQNLQ